MSTIDTYSEALKSKSNPRDIKMKLAYELVKMYHSEDSAKKAQVFFVNTFTKKELPSDMQEFTAVKFDLGSVLLDSKTVASKSEMRRVLSQNGVKVNGNTVTDPKTILNSGDVVQKGKLCVFRVR